MQVLPVKQLSFFLIFCFFLLSGAFFLFCAFPTAAAQAQEPAPDPSFHILAFGDSLTAGYNLPAEQAFPARLEAALKAKGYEVRVTNAGVSGETTAGGLQRVAWVVEQKPDLVILELGANDALRGLPPEEAKQNLDGILRELKAGNIKVLLAGMKAPDNMGKRYVRAFDAMYRDLAKTHKVMLYPFFLEGVATIPWLNQQDGLHPTAEGVDVIVSNIMPFVQSFLTFNYEKMVSVDQESGGGVTTR